MKFVKDINIPSLCDGANLIEDEEGGTEKIRVYMNDLSPGRFVGSKEFRKSLLKEARNKRTTRIFDIRSLPLG